MTHSQTIILLCAPISEGAAPPLTPAKWADLQDKIAAAGLKGPGELAEFVGNSAGAREGLEGKKEFQNKQGYQEKQDSRKETALQEKLGLSPEDAARVAALFQRGDRLAPELERLENIGIWIVTQADRDYPRRVRAYLGRQAPPLLFGIGERSLFNSGGLAIVGSRDVDEAGRACAREAATACASQGIAVISGGARGVDQVSMDAAFQEGGTVIGALADSLEAASARRDICAAAGEGRLALVTPFHPATGFSVGLAMARNKLLYALADWGLVVRADHKKGGSWAGAVEALRNGRRAVFVRGASEAGPGNAALIRRGAIPFPAPPWNDLAARLDRAFEEAGGGEGGEHGKRGGGDPDTGHTQMELF